MGVLAGEWCCSCTLCAKFGLVRIFKKTTMVLVGTYAVWILPDAMMRCITAVMPKLFILLT